MTIHFKPTHMPSLTPYITVSDAKQALDFYTKAFQFELSEEPTVQKEIIVHAELHLGDARIMISPEGAWGSTKRTPNHSDIQSPVNMYIYVADVDKHFEHAKANGADVVLAPENMFWGDRMCILRDKDGYEWSFATNVGAVEPSKMPAAL